MPVFSKRFLTIWLLQRLFEWKLAAFELPRHPEAHMADWFLTVWLLPRLFELKLAAFRLLCHPETHMPDFHSGFCLFGCSCGFLNGSLWLLSFHAPPEAHVCFYNGF